MVGEAANVTDAVPAPGAEMSAGLKVAVAPAGNPFAVSEILELKLPDIVVETCALTELPCCVLTLDGATAIAKSSAVDLITSSAKSSMMKEVWSPWSSTPTR